MMSGMPILEKGVNMESSKTSKRLPARSHRIHTIDALISAAGARAVFYLFASVALRSKSKGRSKKSRILLTAHRDECLSIDKIGELAVNE